MLINAERVIELGIKPYAYELSEIMVTNRIACVVFEPDATMASSAIQLGWDGINPVFQLDTELQLRLARSLRIKDPVCSKWLLKQDYGRILVVVHGSTLLLNHDLIKGGFYVEPPSHTSESELLN